MSVFDQPPELSRPRQRSTVPDRSYAPAKERLFRRFALTIPLNRLVVITYQHYLIDERRIVMGYPHLNLQDVLYVRLTDGGLQIIPKGLVESIQSALKPRDPLPAPESPAMPENVTLLTPEDAVFTLFATAIGKAERVRIEYFQGLRPDPAITDELLNKHGLRTFVEGRAYAMNPNFLEIDLGGEPLPGTEPPEFGSLKQGIPRDRIIAIKFLGPTPVPAE